MSVLSAFNNVLKEFLSDMIRTFPDLQDLKTIQTLCEMLQRINPRMALDNFLSVGGRYHVKILHKQSSFFEDLNNWKNDPYFESEFLSGQSEVFQKLVVFKDIWVGLSETNKKRIWKYFRQLLLFGAMANKNAELADLCKDIIKVGKETNERNNRPKSNE